MYMECIRRYFAEGCIRFMLGYEASMPLPLCGGVVMLGGRELTSFRLYAAEQWMANGSADSSISCCGYGPCACIVDL